MSKLVHERKIGHFNVSVHTRGELAYISLVCDEMELDKAEYPTLLSALSVYHLMCDALNNAILCVN